MKKTVLLIMAIVTGVISSGQSRINNLNIGLSSNGANGCNTGSGAYFEIALRPVSAAYTAFPVAEDLGIILRAPKSDYSLSDAVKIMQVNSLLYGGTATSLMTPQAVVDIGDSYLYLPIALNSAKGLNLSPLTVNNWTFAFTFSFNNPKTSIQLNKLVIVDQINNSALSAFIGSTVFTYLNIGSTNQLTKAAFNSLINPVRISTITAAGPSTLCEGKSVLLKAYSGAGYTYQWKKAGINIAGATLANYTANSSGIYSVVLTNAQGCTITSAATTVVVNPFPVATVTIVGPLTFCSGKSVLLKANPGKGYIYQWKKAGVNIAGATLANYIATASGIYTVLITNAQGCTIMSAATTVVVNPLPVATVTIVGPLTFCSGKTVLLKAYPGAGYTYQWKKAGVSIAGATFANYTATASGIYTVLITNVQGCTITSAATTVVVNPLPVATITVVGSLTFCSGKTVLLKAYPGAGYTYQWKKAGVSIAGATFANYTATASGIYTVLITNVQGCTITSAATTVVVNPLPVATITVVGSLTFCSGKTVLLKAYPGAGYTYQWKKAGVSIAGATFANYTATASGIYTVLITNVQGCTISSAATTVVVNSLPVATVSVVGSLTFCSGKTVLLKAYPGAGYIYQWKKAGVSIAGATFANYTATASGIYTVLITNVQGCTITSAATTVVVNSLPVATVSVLGPLTFCSGKSVLLKAYPGAGYTYQWKKAGVNIAGATLANYTATASGAYTVVITNALGCTITSATTTVVVNPLPVATVTMVGPLAFCADKSVLLKAYPGAGYTYQWKKAGVNIAGATLANYTATTSGVYTVLITNAQGCTITSAATTVVVNPLPVASISPGGPLTFNFGGNVLLNAPAVVGNIYQWKKDGINIIGATTAAYTATTSGSYTVNITNSNLCQATSQPAQVLVNPATTITNAAPLKRQAEEGQIKQEPIIKVYPNPLYGNDYLNIEWTILNAGKGVQIIISDNTGRMIESRFLNSSDKKIRIKGANGIYIVEIKWGKKERKIFRVLKID